MIEIEHDELLKLIEETSMPMFVYVRMSGKPNDKLFYISVGKYQSFEWVNKEKFLELNTDLFYKRISESEFLDKAKKLLDTQELYGFLTDYSKLDFEKNLKDSLSSETSYISYMIDD
ncbi:hypothetical protein [uncultured Vagococcus sp.]|uniref:hypothetical protein n=1 Tax=uncultured Vagococcus sp. TaxID=189676 RepID=UPI0028D2B401|nr:hypothetical protein [uncultured Vagococcus sp.]